MEIKLKIWLEKDGHIVFGKGRDRLLRAIDECKSLSAAVKKIDMTYRGAWGRLKASEERLNIRLVEPHGEGECASPPRGKPSWRNTTGCWRISIRS